MTWKERIIIDPAVLTGKAIIKGIRLSVEFIIDRWLMIGLRTRS